MKTLAGGRRRHGAADTTHDPGSTGETRRAISPGLRRPFLPGLRHPR
ncbi:MAG: hypothetical protein HY342_07460 [Candidatus Lambdaproteobacteria bacterium]|nr:hypothetical protein [Candidatus Lambdaproteobacteria bacterium]